MFAAVSNLIMPLGQKSSDGDCLHISATSSSNGTSGLPVVVQRTSGTACLATRPSVILIMKWSELIAADHALTDLDAN